MRARGLAGHWTYDNGLHSNLLTVLAAERAALAATEILSTSPDRQDVRAAAWATAERPWLVVEHRLGPDLNHGDDNGQG
jgi:hypothetical protein